MLLVGVFVASALIVSESLYYTVRQDHLNAVLQQCEAIIPTDADLTQRNALLGECQQPHERERVVWTLAAFGAAIGVAALAVVARPIVRRARRKLQPVPTTLGMGPVIVEACEAIGARSIPIAMWDPRRLGGAAEVWWRPGRRTIELSPGLVSALCRGVPAARYLLRHEAAHLRSRDVLLGAAADGAGVAFVLTAAIPLIIALFIGFDGPRTTIATALGRLVVVGLVVLLARAAVLRSRELDADGRAAIDGAGASSGQAISSVHERARGWGPLAHHPSEAARRASLTAPVRLLEVGIADGAVAGFAAFLFYPTLSRLVAAWFTGTSGALDAQVWVAALFALPLGVWLGVVALRLATATGLDGRSRRGLRVGVGLAAGALAGMLLLDEPLYQPIELIQGGSVEALALLLIAGVLVGLAAWSAGVATAWYRTPRDGPRLVVPIVVMTCVGTTAVCAKLCETWRNARLGAGLVEGPGRDVFFATANQVWLVSTSLWFTALVVVLALVPALLRWRPAGGTAWAAAVGLWSGVVALAAFLVYDARIHALTSSAELRGAGTAFRYLLVAELLVAAISILGGLLVSMTTDRSIVLGMFTVGVASIVGSAGVMAKLWRDGADVGFGDLVSQVAGQIIPLSVLGGLMAAPLMALLSARLRARRLVTATSAAFVSLAVLLGAGIASAAYGAALVPSRRETLSDYREWWEGERDVVAPVLVVCAGDDPAPLEEQPDALTAARRLVDAYEPQTAALNEVHTHLGRALSRCEGVLDVLGGEQIEVLDAQSALLSELSQWTGGVSTITDDEWTP
jgi:hypothetical protein